MSLLRGLIKLLNQLTTPANTVKGELSAKRLRRGAEEMLRRRFARLQCEIKSGMELSRGAELFAAVLLRASEPIETLV